MAASVSVLVVADGDLRFTTEYFSIRRFVDILRATTGPVTFQVTTARRGTQRYGADLISFAFTDASLSRFDEVWLFGHLRPSGWPSGPPITDDEVAAIVRFMNAGGGVFATGDHEDLGVQMCGRIPRVRSMRKWYWPNPGPNGEPVAPVGDRTSANLHKRHDTLQPDDQGVFWFENEADARPQPISVRTFTSPGGISSVHPILRGTTGTTLNVLPDHAHEGECIEPWTLTWRYRFGSVEGDEYPLANGQRLRPQIIADAIVFGGHTTPFREPGQPTKAMVDGKVYGVAGVYDGHQVPSGGGTLGRVFVDATWHHFMNGNLQGFPAGIMALTERYFRNIATWLARRPQQQEILAAALEEALHTYPLAESIPDADPTDLDAAVLVGASARMSLGQLAPLALAELMQGTGYADLNPFAGAASGEEAAEREPEPLTPFVDPEVFGNAALGGAILQFVKSAGNAEEGVAVEGGAAVAVEGARTALAQVPASVSRALARLFPRS